MFFTAVTITVIILSARVIRMITSGRDIILIMLQCSEVKVMSVLTAIFQAIAQALAWIFPISESGHSAIFHDFSGRFSGACSQLTGIVHIGIAIGIFIACFPLFRKLFVNFFTCGRDIVKKQFDIHNLTAVRRFMLMTMLSLLLFVFYLIPAGRSGNLYQLFSSFSYNGTLLDEGICLALTGALLLLTVRRINKVNPIPPVFQALVIGAVAFLAVPTAGCSLVAGVFCVGVLIGMNPKLALKYSLTMSFVYLIAQGIFEICTGVTPVSVAQVIIAVVISAAAAFFFVKLLLYVIRKKLLAYFAWYDVIIGVLCVIIGVLELIIRR